LNSGRPLYDFCGFFILRRPEMKQGNDKKDVEPGPVIRIKFEAWQGK